MFKIYNFCWIGNDSVEGLFLKQIMKLSKLSQNSRRTLIKTKNISKVHKEEHTGNKDLLLKSWEEIGPYMKYISRPQ